MGILLVSCESEYERQLTEAKSLVQEELLLNESAGPAASTAGDIRHLLEEVEKEIVFRARLSGNEEVFLRELGSYREELLTKDPIEKQVLITKYP
jgi:hypothetical protein